MALVPEDEAVPAGLTARQFVPYLADLPGVADRERAGARARPRVELLDVADRASTGSARACASGRKVAAALVCDPQVLVLDEPLNGADPVQRLALIDAVQASSAPRAAPSSSARTCSTRSSGWPTGDRAGPRPAGRGRRPPGHPRRDGRPAPPRARPRRRRRRLAAALVGLESVAGVTFDAIRDGLVVQTRQARELRTALPRLARDARVRLLEVRALDDSLESLFRELVR